MEDKAKVDEVISELNGDLKSPIWFPVDGFKLFPNISYKPGRKDVTVTPSSGYPVKLFVNVNTGEVKAYAASLFEVTNE